MGNVPISCCRYNNDDACSCADEYKVKYQYSKYATTGDQQPPSILQHISEREPDDSENDPSSNPFNQPIFVARSVSTLKNNSTIGRPETYQTEMFKSSSCSTIFTDSSTITQPDLKLTIKCVSLAIFYHIKHRSSDRTNDIFDEVIHPLRMPINKSDITQSIEPNQRNIYDFVKTLFNAAQLTAEYAITTLVYLERLMTYAEIDLTPRTWRRMFLGAILLSSKVWEDQAVWNVDYAQILEEISVEDINELERQFLELIQFNMNVPSSVYAKYYFDLRSLAMENGLSAPKCTMKIERARNLGIRRSVSLFIH